VRSRKLNGTRWADGGAWTPVATGMTDLIYALQGTGDYLVGGTVKGIIYRRR